MSISDLKNSLLDSAKDIKLNLSMVLSPEGAPDLTREQVIGVAMACAFATQNTTVIAALGSEFQSELTEPVEFSAQAAASMMAMNNVYYRFIHLVKDPAFASLPAKLRMNVIANPGVAHQDFELSCLAVSAINGCGLCMESHTRTLMKSGMSVIGIQSCIRIAATIHAVAQSIFLSGMMQV